jgi:uncharacterized protein
MTPETLARAPVARSERISAVDTVRGFALLGILLMNIVSFALPHGASDDPTIAGGSTGPNLAVWAINYILFEGKMRALFSMLFGAGVVLLTSRLEARDGAIPVADIYYRRTLWLLAFGVAHAYFLWAGDILYSYAVVGLMLFPFRKVGPKRLMVAGLLLMAVQVPKTVMRDLQDRSTREKAAAADAAASAGTKLTEDQVSDQKTWEEWLKRNKPAASEIAKEVADYHAGYWKLFLRRQADVVDHESRQFYRYSFLDVSSMMLLGMGLIKLGFFSATRSYREYAAVAFVGYLTGISVNSYTAYQYVQVNFEWWRVGPGSLDFLYDFERLMVALAHASVLMMILKAGAMGWLTSRLAAVGQMALSNYLFDSIACTTLFHGFGFGLFGKLERYQIYVVLLAIWTFQLIVSKIWLAHFRFGPLEWLWRSLTYWQRQPMRLADPRVVPSLIAGSPA